MSLRLIVLLFVTGLLGEASDIAHGQQPAGLSATQSYRSAMAKAVRAASQRVLPSLVTVEVVGTVGAAAGEVEQDAPTSGVIIDSEGFILTSSIVVRKPSASILVVLPDGSRHAAQVVATDYHRDLVLLKIDINDLPSIDLASQPELTVGQTTIAVGRYGNDGSPMVSQGVLSAVGRLDGIAIQTDARVSASLYGGLLIDLQAQPLGVLIPAVAEGGAEDATSWYDSGIAFAIPVDVIANKIARLKAGEDIEKGLIGIVAKTSDPYADGTQIATVRRRSPAEAAGLKAGDEVLEVAGQAVRRHQEIKLALGRFDAGESVRIKVRRGEQELEVETTLAASIPPLEPQRLGVVAVERAIEGQEDAGESISVVVVAIVPGSSADGKLQVGDAIVRVGDAKVDAIESLRKLLVSAEPDQPLELQIARNDKSEKVTLTPRSIAGRLDATYPPSWQDESSETWRVEPIQLPDAANDAAYIAPGAGTGDAADDPDAGSNEGQRERLGLMILLLRPGQGAPADVLKDWAELAPQAGVVVCAIAAEDEGRWKPKEMDIVAKFAAAVMKKAAIDPSAVAVTAGGALAGSDADASDAMALAVAISQSKTFFGVAVSDKARPPAVRLRENEPDSALQLLLPTKTTEDLPGWATAVTRAGYPIVLGGDIDRESLLRWVRLLQAI